MPALIFSIVRAILFGMATLGVVKAIGSVITLGLFLMAQAALISWLAGNDININPFTAGEDIGEIMSDLLGADALAGWMAYSIGTDIILIAVMNGTLAYFIVKFIFGDRIS